MDVALDTAPTGLFGLHDAGPRGRQLARLALDLGQTLGELGGERRVPNGKRRLSAECLQQLMVPRLEGRVFLGTTLDRADMRIVVNEWNTHRRAGWNSTAATIVQTIATASGRRSLAASPSTTESAT